VNARAAIMADFAMTDHDDVDDFPAGFSGVPLTPADGAVNP